MDKLSPGAYRNGMVELLTTVSSPCRPASSASTLTPGTSSVWLRPLYSDSCSAVHDGGNAAHAAIAAVAYGHHYDRKPNA